MTDNNWHRIGDKNSDTYAMGIPGAGVIIRHETESYYGDPENPDSVTSTSMVFVPGSWIIKHKDKKEGCSVSAIKPGTFDVRIGVGGVGEEKSE